MRPVGPSLALIAIAALGLTACDDGGSIDEPGPCDLTYDLLLHLRVDEVRHPEPVLAGTQFLIRGESFVDDAECVSLEAALLPASGSDIPLEASRQGTNEVLTTLSEEGATQVREARGFDGELVIRYHSLDDNDRLFRAATPLTFDATDILTPSVMDVEQSEAHLNDQIFVNGDGFLTGEEGTTVVTIEGTFTAGGDGERVSVELPAQPVEVGNRQQAAFLWSPTIGGLEPGQFEGSLTVENQHRSGERTAGDTVDLVMTQRETIMLDITPAELSLGQFAHVHGRGFIGDPDGTTVIRLEGTFTPLEGDPVTTPIELIGTWISGTQIDYALTVGQSRDDDQLIAVDFGTARGQFEGTATPVLTLGSQPVEGQGTEVSFTLGPVRQVIWLRFLTGFSDSLDYYGLGAVEALVRERVVTRLQDLYCPPDNATACVNVHFVTDEPVEYYDGGYGVLDIGGPDPNSLGLLGYDNTGDKDMGNRRLHDHVGGENALGDIDGFAYGGVFVDSFLYWSDHPPFDDRPEMAPAPDPRFDQVFDPLRQDEVVAGEYPGDASGERLEQIETAIHFITSVIADTAAHEVAHSLGLAQPYGDAEALHNPTPGEGCLMDEADERPLEERARLDGNPGAHFCGENLTYLLEILPVE